MNFLQQLITELLGTYSAAFYVTYFIFVLIGVFISLRINLAKRDKKSVYTPFAFSWSFFLQDNIFRIITSMAMVFVTIRLGTEMMNVIPTYPGAVILGLGMDQALIRLEKFTLTTRRK